MASQVSIEMLESLRQVCDAGARVTQAQITGWHQAWRDAVSPSPSDEELLVLVNEHGQPFSPRLMAQRWLCHLLGLRHQAVHILLTWHSPGAGPMLVCQVRSLNKQDFPGHIDMSVGGHVKGQDELYDTALTEMSQELGLTPHDLVQAELSPVGGYACCIERPDLAYYDLEYRTVYVGQVKDLEPVHFHDREVDGMYLCPVDQAEALLQQTILPVANGLRLSLPCCLAHFKRD
ncbi:MAG: NUDIX domain-containing protein [Phycisphaerae bacterium]|nr:NUDIX domain-containing protein [Phycisphaerae bacterium]